MADAHLYAINGLTGAAWSVAGVRAFNCWVWDGSSWRPVLFIWVFDGSTYQLGFDPTPGPLASIVVSPSSVGLSQGDTFQFTAAGFDADGRSVSITPTWTRSTPTDSIDSSGNFTAGFTTSSGTVHAAVGAISGSADYEVA